MKYRLKIVPNGEPNADGRWIEVDVDVDINAAPCWDGHGPVVRWSDAALFFTRYVPAGEHLVAYERA